MGAAAEVEAEAEAEMEVEAQVIAAADAEVLQMMARLLQHPMPSECVVTVDLGCQCRELKVVWVKNHPLPCVLAAASPDSTLSFAPSDTAPG